MSKCSEPENLPSFKVKYEHRFFQVKATALENDISSQKWGGGERGEERGDSHLQIMSPIAEGTNLISEPNISAKRLH